MSQPDPLDLIRRQIVDLQERTTALEKTPPSQRPDGALEGLLAAGLKAVAGTVRTAAEAKAARTAEPTDALAPEPTRPAVRDAVQRARDTVARAEAAAAPLFPIAEPEPAAPFAGRTAPRRTTPPEAPVRLWNPDHTDHLDVIGRAVPTPGKTRVRIRDDQVDAVRAWLAPLIEPDDAGPVYVAWMDREWSLAGYAGEYGAEHQSIKLDLLPIPKPPRADQVLGREPLNIAEMRAGAEAMRARSPKARCPGCMNPTEHGHYPWCPAGFTVGPGRGRAEGEPIPAGRGGPAPYTVDEWPLPEPVGTVTSGLIHTRPSDHPEGPCCGRDEHGLHDLGCDAIEPDVDEVLPMPGSPNDKLSPGAQAAADVTRSAEFLREHPTAMHPETAQAITRRGYADLYSRLDAIHDAVDTEES